MSRIIIVTKCCRCPYRCMYKGKLGEPVAGCSYKYGEVPGEDGTFPEWCPLEEKDA